MQYKLSIHGPIFENKTIKTHELFCFNLWFSDVFREYRNITLGYVTFQGGIKMEHWAKIG